MRLRCTVVQRALIPTGNLVYAAQHLNGWWRGNRAQAPFFAAKQQAASPAGA